MPFARSLRFAWRSLRRTPAFTVTASLTLVIGIAATVAIFAVVNGVLLRPLPYRDADRLVGAWHDLPPLGLTQVNQTSATYFTYRRFVQSIEEMGVYQNSAVNVSDPGGAAEPQRLDAAFISAGVLPVLGVIPAAGRNFSAEEDLPNGPSVAIISHSLWQNRFGGDAAIIGRTLEVNGRTREIIGVMPRDFRFSVATNQLWLPLALDPNNPYPGGFSFDAIARLQPGVTIERARREFATVLPRLVEVSPNFAPGFSTTMLLDQAKPTPVLTSLHADITGGIARTLWMVATAAGLVLLVACANVANLILVRADARQRELAVREALGAGRARVMSYFLAESVVLVGLAALAGLGLATVAVRVLVSAGPADLPRIGEIGIDGATLVFTLGVAALVAIVCSVVPALRIGRIPLFSALRDGGRGGTAGRAQHRVRGALVAAQIALALVVLAGSGVLVRTFARLNAVQPGFDSRNVATLWLSVPSARYANDSAFVRFYEQLQSRVAELPGIQAAGLTSRLPLLPRGQNSSPLYPSDDQSYAQKVPPLQLFTSADAGYFEAMRIPIIAGRNFERIALQRETEAIISRRTAIQFWKDSTGRAAVGKRFRQLPTGPEYTVIGVAGDVRDTALAAPPSQTVYFPQVAGDSLYGQARRTMALVVRAAGDPRTALSAAQQVIRDIDPTLPAFDVRPMETVMRASTARLSFIIAILGSAAAVALILGAVGLYGVMAYLVTLRTRELGVRIALGAQPQAVAAMMARQGLGLTVIGIAAGLGVFALVARFLQSFLYGVAPTDPLTLAAASLLLLGIAMLASWIPARRALRIAPSDALRAE